VSTGGNGCPVLDSSGDAVSVSGGGVVEVEALDEHAEDVFEGEMGRLRADVEGSAVRRENERTWGRLYHYSRWI
jgi:hypothetical protein